MTIKTERGCHICKLYAELKQPYVRSDGATIYGYCFKDGDKALGMGKGYPVWIDGGGAACKSFKRRKGLKDIAVDNEQIKMEMVP